MHKVMIFQVLNVFMTRKYELNKDGSCREHLRQVEHENVFSQLKNLGRNKNILRNFNRRLLEDMAVFLFTVFKIKGFIKLVLCHFLN